MTIFILVVGIFIWFVCQYLLHCYVDMLKCWFGIFIRFSSLPAATVPIRHIDADGVGYRNDAKKMAQLSKSTEKIETNSITMRRCISFSKRTLQKLAFFINMLYIWVWQAQASQNQVYSFSYWIILLGYAAIYIN